MFKLFILLINISPLLSNEYLCPVDAYGWIISDNSTKQISKWIYNENTKQFDQDLFLNHKTEIGEKYIIKCFDVHYQIYRPIYLNKKDFQINWKCNYENNQGEIRIKSWIFNNQRLSPKTLYLQIGNGYRTEIIHNKIKKINMKIIQRMKRSLIKTQGNIFWELHLNYGEYQGSITLQIRPIFEQRLYILPLYSDHKNDSYIDIDCPSTEDIDNHSISWFNYTTPLLSSFDSKIHLQYFQLFSSELSCVINDCFTCIVIYIHPKYN